MTNYQKIIGKRIVKNTYVDTFQHIDKNEIEINVLKIVFFVFRHCKVCFKKGLTLNTALQLFWNYSVLP